MANTVLLVRGQPWRCDRRDVDGRARRVVCGGALAVPPARDGGGPQRAGGAAVPPVGTDIADASAVGEGGDDQQVAVLVVAGERGVPSGRRAVDGTVLQEPETDVPVTGVG